MSCEDQGFDTCSCFGRHNWDKRLTTGFDFVRLERTWQCLVGFGQLGCLWLQNRGKRSLWIVLLISAPEGVAIRLGKQKTRLINRRTFISTNCRIEFPVFC